MTPSLFNNSDSDEYLSESRQKIALPQTDDFEERRLQIERSRNGFIGTLAGITLAAVVSWLVLLPRLSAQNQNDIPVIRRLATPAKIQPTDPGGMDIPNQDKSIYQLVEKKDGTDLKPESLLPQPEAPQMPTIAAVEETPETPENATTSDDTQDLLEVKPLDEKIESVKVSGGQKINIPEKPKHIPSEIKTVPVATPSVQPATPNQAEKKPVSKVESPILKGVWQIQLMASAHKNAVEDAWTKQVQKYHILADLPHEIESVSTGSQTMYRLKAGNFKQRQEADALCTQIKAAGGSCVVKQK